MSSFCSYFDNAICRSCAWLERPYEDQIRAKEAAIREALAFLAPFSLEAPALSPTQGFRNRAKMAVTGTLDAPIIGLTGENELDEGRELLTCPLHHPKLNELISALPRYLTEFRISPYQIASRQGELKGLIAFHSSESDQTYLRFVLRSRTTLDALRKMIPRLQERFPNLQCVSANIQPIPHAILEGPEEIVLTSRPWIVHQMGAVALKLAPRAFVQTNATVARELYETAASWIGEVHPARFMELFCGQGAFSFFAAPHAEALLGIEINPDAVRMAQESAQELGLTHLRFQSLDATRVENEVRAFAPQVLLVNPPRRGLANGVEIILHTLPAHFLYSSCSVETLAKDLRVLAPHYQVRKARLFDMFPHTSHFETLVWLERK